VCLASRELVERRECCAFVMLVSVVITEMQSMDVSTGKRPGGKEGENMLGKKEVKKGHC
jgi:hypothetical protein